ncbi:hypothetical protein TSTA_117580 [Talaromyces stipitatus ATCC 10500]|uniref:Uncharacterized protein n=1 Tax=Talaromyces stipitatus (strain ATCC 10500 / CBS 375.48 / QM 6759 / NRRL 1006) TaxID=441959 RepID=B8MDL8_TALSN|nr:uncharacterized protein TSTA_117580 [Talaromyces stipitatus ATCC 10500]EED17981.1 hypothetical protein TSTA_117580 [Talaromyces stipitatus ATCC 10500]
MSSSSQSFPYLGKYTVSSTWRLLQTTIYLLIINIILSFIQAVMARRPAAPPSSPIHTTVDETILAYNNTPEERDMHTFEDLCESRIDILHAQYNLVKDTLHKAMGVADMWWAAEKINDLELQETLGSKLIDEIILPYFTKVRALVDEHEDRFSEDGVLLEFSEYCADAVSQCFTPIEGYDYKQVFVEKEVAEICTALTHYRKEWGRKIFLEKGVRNRRWERILKKPAEALTVTTWSLLWARQEKKEDQKLWVITPLEDIEWHQRDAFNRIKNERLAVHQRKMELAEDYWDWKLDLEDKENLLDNAADDDDWAAVFDNSSVKSFELVIRNTKLHLMKDFNIFNFRFLGTLTDKIAFEEYLYSKRPLDMRKTSWPGFVRYRLKKLEVEKGRDEKLEFVPVNDTGE